MPGGSKKKNLPLVPESILKRRHDLDHLVRLRAASAQQQQQQRQTGKKKAVYVKKPETILARAKSKRNHNIRYRRVLKKGMQKRASPRPQMAVKEIVDDEEQGASSKTTTTTYQSNSVGAKMVFCIRQSGDGAAMPRSVKRALARLRLRHVHDGVFLRYDASHQTLLHLVEPFVVYGPPTPQMVHDLIQRRGFCKDANGQRRPLSDNTVIEAALGDECGLLCVEDLVQEIVTVGDHFTKVTQFLWPFRLADSKTEFERKTLKIKDNGKQDYGDKGAAVNDYIQEVL